MRPASKLKAAHANYGNPTLQLLLLALFAQTISPSEIFAVPFHRAKTVSQGRTVDRTACENGKCLSAYTNNSPALVD